MAVISRSTLRLLAVAVVIGMLPMVLAHGDDEPAMDMDMGGGEHAEVPETDPSTYAPTYFAHPEYSSTIYAHIIFMSIAWIVVLPVAVMFSLVRSRYTLAVQFVFLATNALAVLLGVNYNANTPDLYPNNAHHKIGWIATWVVSAQVLVGVVGRVAGVMKKNWAQDYSREEQGGFMPISTEAMEEHSRLNDSMYTERYRSSHDSGQGTERNTESLRSNSVSNSGQQSPDVELEERRMHYGDDEDLELKQVELNPPKASNSFISKLASKISTRAWKFILFGYNAVDRVILILGFIAWATGIITFGRFFEGHQVFTGLAHWIKGGVFFWLGLLTLGRWSGCFAEYGWAWNLRPKRASGSWRPSAEFVEGFLIFFYGSTNIFLENLGNADIGNGYSAQDLEHLSITVLFLGGGLLAMLVESTWIRDLLNTTVEESALSHPAHTEEERENLKQPQTYEFSINPIPALIILLLGIMMSSHTQQSMTSSMIHKQWGNLLSAGAFARGGSYVIMYLKPPRSIYPSRPPTELLAAFGLIGGGLIFMASSGDTVDGMIHYGVDAMVMYTIGMGFVAMLMAWVVLVLALKGWAARRESGKLQNTWARHARV